MKGYFKELNLIRKSTYFKAITKHTKYCAGCGEVFDMIRSGHHHLPFCEDCRKDIIKKEFNNEEVKNGK